MLKSLLLVGAGSCIGGMLRYLMLLLIKTPSNGFPLAVLLVNLAGCFLIGLFYGIFSKLPFANSELLFFLTTGICGGFTTFSTFANDSLQLLNSQNWWLFAAYVGASVIFGILATFAGYGAVNLFSR